MRNKKALYIILIVQLLEIITYAMLLPLIPFQTQKLGANPFTVGLLFATYSLFQFVAAPILGRYSDKLGRKTILLISQIGTVIGFILLGFSNSLFYFFISRIIDGISGGNQLVSYAVVSDVTNDANRTKAFGYMNGMLGIGFLIGPAIGASLYYLGFSIVAYIAAFLSFLTIIIMLFLLPETRVLTDQKVEASNISSFIKQPLIRSILFQIFFIVLIMNTFITGFPIFAQKQLSYTAQYVGYTLTLIGFVGIIVQLLILGKLVNKFGDKRTSEIGFFLLAVGFLLLTFTHNTVLLSLALIVITPGIVLSSSTTSSLLTQSVSKHKHGEVLGIHQSINSICQIIGPLLGGLILAKFNSAFFGLIIAFLALLGLLIPLYQKKQKRLI